MSAFSILKVQMSPALWDFQWAGWASGIVLVAREVQLSLNRVFCFHSITSGLCFGAGPGEAMCRWAQMSWSTGTEPQKLIPTLCLFTCGIQGLVVPLCSTKPFHLLFLSFSLSKVLRGLAGNIPSWYGGSGEVPRRFRGSPSGRCSDSHYWTSSSAWS